MQCQQQFVIYCALHLTRSYFYRCIVAQLRLSYSLYGSTIQKLVCRVCNIDIITTKAERERERESQRKSTTQTPTDISSKFSVQPDIK